MALPPAPRPSLREALAAARAAATPLPQPGEAADALATLQASLRRAREAAETRLARTEAAFAEARRDQAEVQDQWQKAEEERAAFRKDLEEARQRCRYDAQVAENAFHEGLSTRPPSSAGSRSRPLTSETAEPERAPAPAG